jgi:uncharacterized protein YcbK (DUF882 family)
MAFGRKRFLTSAFLAVTLLGGMAAPAQAQAQAPLAAMPAQGESRSLSFRIARDVAPDNTVRYTDDIVHSFTYFHNGAYDPAALAGINQLLRDPARDAAAPQGMDRRLLETLFTLKEKLAAAHPGREIVFHVISGYRSPETNAALRTDPNNPFRASVSKTSEHMRGKAIDIFIPGLSGEELRDAAWRMQRGGVGFYPQFKDQFPYGYIHVDSGPVRHWGFDPAKISCR